MKLYSGKIRLAGNLLNEVPRIGLTAPEIIILRHIHGADAVVNIQETGSDKRPHGEERDRLAQAYNPKVVFDLFGLEHRELPIELPRAEVAGAEDDEIQPKRHRRGKSVMPGIPAPQPKTEEMLA